MTRFLWAVGVAVFVLAALAAVQVGLALPLGYDSRAYWLAARHMLDGAPLYPAQNATLGASGEFHYLPLVAAPFVAFLPLPIDTFVNVFLVLEIALAAAVGVALIRQLPNAARPWAAAAYAFFTPMILEVTLGNLDLASLALALLAWHWRGHAGRGAVALGAAIGIKFMPAILLPFYLAAGRRAIVMRAFLIGVAVLLVSLPFLWVPTLDFIDLVPRYADTAWVRIIVAREEPKLFADIMWSDVFPLVLGVAAVAFAVVCGRMAKREPERETDWHHLALA
ncbi:MAG TPA: glycosyltransferase 87 family protein, partial [Methylomirabilota bacterium]|nr:glycosyltransferase 87 family protein [Methylomirabilota bacterium]